MNSEATKLEPLRVMVDPDKMNELFDLIAEAKHPRVKFVDDIEEMRRVADLARVQSLNAALALMWEHVPGIPEGRPRGGGIGTPPPTLEAFTR